MTLQPIYNIAETCARKNINQVVLSPGSRCAPLTLAFARHPDIQTRIIGDERSAAFIAIGISQQLKMPVALVCTSGSAAYNYAPAVAEAFYQEVPLIIFTADRPPEWIDQWDGQTIRQKSLYASHVKQSFELPVDRESGISQWHIERVVSEAINTARYDPQGPVHINVPLREPLYPKPDEGLKFDQNIKVIESIEPEYHIGSNAWEKLEQEILKFEKVLILGGQSAPRPELVKLLSQISEKCKIPIMGDVTSNLHDVEGLIKHQDLFLGQMPENEKEKLRPDLLISFGRSVVSKNLKLFLRKYRPKAHWHIQPAGNAADTFQSLAKVIHTTPVDFFSHWIDPPIEWSPSQEQFLESWLVPDQQSERLLKDFFISSVFGECEAVKGIIIHLPAHCQLHLANSMAVRYANFMGLRNKENVKVWANRGTSGIDGSNGTAVGHSLASEQVQVLITGDMAFFYDRNAFWHKYPIPNLRIVILNNHGGGIFRMIDGPSTLPELEEYFETQQSLNADKAAEEFGFDHIICNDRKAFASAVEGFFQPGPKPKILEIETSSALNKEILNDLKNNLQEQLNQLSYGSKERLENH